MASKKAIRAHIAGLAARQLLGGGGPEPQMISPPVISGTYIVDYPLTTTNGTWTNSPTSYTYQWYRDDVAISGATSSSYFLVEADIGALISVEVTAYNEAGASVAEPSADTSTIADVTTPTPEQDLPDTSQSASSSTATWPGDTTSGNLLVLTLAIDNDAYNTVSITDNYSNTWQMAAESVDGVIDARCQIWYAEDITGGSNHQVTVTLDGVTQHSYSGIEFSNAKTTNALDTDSIVETTAAAAGNGEFSVTTGQLRTRREIVVGIAATGQEISGDGFNDVAGWTTLYKIGGGAVSCYSGHIYKQVASKDPVDVQFDSLYVISFVVAACAFRAVDAVDIEFVETDQLYAEVITTGKATAEVDQLYAEVITTGVAEAEADQVYVEVIRSTTGT